MQNTTPGRLAGLALVAGALLIAPQTLAQTVDKFVDSARYDQRSLWTIEKTADASEVILDCDQTFDVDYEVTVRKVARTGEQFPEGRIIVTNTTGGPLTLNGVEDIAQSSGNPAVQIPLDVTCAGIAFPYVMAADEVVNCTFEGRIMEPTELQTVDLNEAIATFGGGATTSSGLIPYATQFGGQTDLCIDVSDDLQGPLGVVCFPELEHTFAYTRPVGPFAAPGVYQVVNTASFYGTDSGPGGAPDSPGLPGSATGEASWTVTATVECDGGGGGCNRTIGYWKTHSSYGPAGPADPTWEDLPQGPDTPFLNTPVSWYTLFWTPPAGGNHYINLAHQWMGATLNVMSGADGSVLGTVLADAQALMENNPGCRTNWATCPAGVKTQMNTWAGLLDDYNNGDLPGGPGHCGDGGANATIGGVTDFALGAPAPNPTSGMSSIRFDVPASSQIVLIAYDVMGREVARLADDFYQAGTHEVYFEGANLPAGTYFIRMSAGEFHDVTRVVIAR